PASYAVSPHDAITRPVASPPPAAPEPPPVPDEHPAEADPEPEHDPGWDLGDEDPTASAEPAEKPEISTPSSTEMAGDGAVAGDLHVPDRRFAIRLLDESVIERSSFLDTRIEAPPGETQPLTVAEAEAAAAAGLPRAPVGWIFHTSFCASTLLARCLHLAPF